MIGRLFSDELDSLILQLRNASNGNVSMIEALFIRVVCILFFFVKLAAVLATMSFLLWVAYGLAQNVFQFLPDITILEMAAIWFILYMGTELVRNMFPSRS